MKTTRRKNIMSAALACAVAFIATVAQAADPLPSWNDGKAKQSIIEFVEKVTKAGSPDFVQPTERIATFDQDGTLWVEKPMASQVMYCFDRVGTLVKEKPELKNVEPFKTVLSANRAAIAKLTMLDLEKILLEEGFRVREVITTRHQPAVEDGTQHSSSCQCRQGKEVQNGCQLKGLAGRELRRLLRSQWNEKRCVTSESDCVTGNKHE
jgi:hypothetical protein